MEDKKRKAGSATLGPPSQVEVGMEGLLPEEIPALRVFLRRLVIGCPFLEVEDLLQQSMQRALQYQHRFDSSRPLGPWLQQLAFRVFLDARAQALQQPSSMNRLTEEVEDLAPASSSPLRSELESWLQAMPQPQGEVLRRFYLLEQSIEQIAADMELASGTVKSHLHRGRKYCAQHFAAEAWL